MSLFLIFWIFCHFLLYTIGNCETSSQLPMKKEHIEVESFKELGMIHEV